MEKQKEINNIDWLNFFALSTIWGFSFFFIKKGLEVFEPLEVAAFRMSIAFFALLPFIIYNFKKLKIDRKKWKYIPLLGVFGNLIPAIMFCTAETQIDSGLVGIMNATTPLFALFIGAATFGVALSKNKILGVVVGFVGVLIIILSKIKGIEKDSINFYILLPLIATICYGINANLFKKFFQNENPLIIALLQYSAIATVTIPYLLLHNTIHKIQLAPAQSWNSLKYLLVLGIFGTGFAQVGFNILTQRVSALFATMTTFIIPIVSVIIAFVIGEQLLPIHILGLGTILFGVYLGSRS